MGQTSSLRTNLHQDHRQVNVRQDQIVDAVQVAPARPVAVDPEIATPADRHLQDERNSSTGTPSAITVDPMLIVGRKARLSRR